jgi:pimeloyl-ACP methyl ester carboxylesterase
MGGNVVAHIAQQMPERVAGLVMVDAAIAWQNENDANDVASWLLRVPPLRRWLRIGLRLALTEARYRSILESAVADPTFVTPDVAAGYYRPQRVDGWDLALLGIVRDRGRSGLSAPLQQVSAPTLIIWGKQDSWVPLAAGRRLDASLPNSEMVVMDDTGHLPMEERPEEFNRILLDWLQAQ